MQSFQKKKPFQAIHNHTDSGTSKIYHIINDVIYIIHVCDIATLPYLVFIIGLREHPLPDLLPVQDPIMVEVSILLKLLLALRPLSLTGSLAKHRLHILGKIQQLVTIRVVILNTNCVSQFK